MFGGLRMNASRLAGIILAIFIYPLWFFADVYCNASANISTKAITTMSWIGILVILIYVIIWRKTTDQYFSLYNIFLAFFIVFNFGQCLLWAFGIHTDFEIGQKKVFSSVMADNEAIFRAQMLFVICFITLNSGALMAWKNKKNKTVSLQYIQAGEDKRYKYLFYTAMMISIVAIPVSFYNAIYRLLLRQVYGYRSLYYGDASLLLNRATINILSALFIPCLLGLLIGSRYKKGVRGFVYGVYAVYAVITLLCGDRGEWINGFIILAWAHHAYYKKMPLKKLVGYGIICLILLVLVNAIVSIRNSGLSWSGFIEALFSAEENAIVSMLMEFGHSMGISIILLMEDVVFPYGNTYLMSIPTLLSTNLAKGLFGLEYIQLHTWFSQHYLRISYGADFSMIGEAVLNFGIYIAPLIIMLEGFILSKSLQLINGGFKSPLGMCVGLGAMTSVIKLPRTTIWLTMNSFVYSMIIFILIYGIVKMLFGVQRTRMRYE